MRRLVLELGAIAAMAAVTAPVIAIVGAVGGVTTGLALVGVAAAQDVRDVLARRRRGRQ